LLFLTVSLVGPSVALAADADLSVFINHFPPAPVGLEQVVFTIHVSNLGPAPATGI
jgi:hypothetical protein